MEQQLSPLEELGREVAVTEDALLENDVVPASVKNRVLARVAARPKHRRLVRKLSLAAAAAMILAVGLTAVLASRHRAATQATTRGIEPGAWFATPPERDSRLEFHDGSSVTLQPGSGARVMRDDDHGAILLLERGAAEIAVRHQADTRWSVSAGPFAVEVTGTRFYVAWQPDLQRFSLTLAEGQVIIRGPLLEDGRRVSKGETLSVSLVQRRVEFQGATLPTTEAFPLDASEPVSETPMPSSVPSSAVKRQPRGFLAAQQEQAEGAPLASWQKLTEAGLYQEALRAANERGLDTVLQEATARELVSLGDAARLAGDVALAARSYRMVRERFANAEEAALAAFSLGKLAFDQQHDRAAATRWLELYLRERPQGGLRREALGRLLEARSSTGHARDAVKAAQEYLAEYPTGPHAAFAKQCLAADTETGHAP